jgi:hypothetical protein
MGIALLFAAALRGLGAPKNLQCALPEPDFQITQRFTAFIKGLISKICLSYRISGVAEGSKGFVRMAKEKR